MCSLMWPSRTTELMTKLRIKQPIVQAPMAGAAFSEVAIGAGKAGGLASLGCALLDEKGIRDEVAAIRKALGDDAPLNLNFFVHPPPERDAAREDAWRRALDKYY